MTGWVKLAGRSFVAAGVVGAAQLGVAQALAVLVWSTAPTPDVWRRHLTWLVFIFAAAVLGGVAGGRRSVREIRRAIANRRADSAAARHAGLVAHQRGLRAARRRAIATARSRTVDTARGVAAMATRISATAFAALGAVASFALVWLPARNAFAPADIRVLAISAGVGIAVGAVLSLLSLITAPIAANVGVWLMGLWMFGLTSVGIAIAADQPTITPRLGVLDAPQVIGPDEWWLGPNLMVAVAAAFGAAVAGTARWLAAHRLAIALSGVAGPSVLAAAYLLVGPSGDLMSSYVAALLAATVGLLTSAATAAANRGSSAVPAARTPAAITAGAAAAAARRPLAIESGQALQPAAQKATQKQVPKKPARKPAAIPNPAALYPAADPVYLAPPRSAPVPLARVSPPVPPQRSMPPPAAPPAPPPPRPAAAPAAPAPPPAAPVVAPRAQPTAPSVAPQQRPAEPTTTKPAAAKPGDSGPDLNSPAATPAAKKPARGKAAAKQAQEKPAGGTTAAKPAGRGSRRGRSDRATTSARVEHPASNAGAEVLPRTARPAEVVAVEALPKGRRARRRAAKLAAERAAAQEQLMRLMEREATTMNKREREHVDWVKHLVSLPDDPTLTNRQK